MGSVHPPTPALPQFGLPRQHAAAAVALVPDDGSDCESVAESSSPRPCPRRPTASAECDEDEDGCSSCVEGCELSYYREGDVDDDGEEVSTASVWWKKRLAAPSGDGCVFPAAEEEVEDPERAAARQAEDRKFWEDCLGTGYP